MANSGGTLKQTSKRGQERANFVGPPGGGGQRKAREHPKEGYRTNPEGGGRGQRRNTGQGYSSRSLHSAAQGYSHKDIPDFVVVL